MDLATGQMTDISVDSLAALDGNCRECLAHVFSAAYSIAIPRVLCSVDFRFRDCQVDLRPSNLSF